MGAVGLALVSALEESLGLVPTLKRAMFLEEGWLWFQLWDALTTWSRSWLDWVRLWSGLQFWRRRLVLVLTSGVRSCVVPRTDDALGEVSSGFA